MNRIARQQEGDTGEYARDVEGVDPWDSVLWPQYTSLRKPPFPNRIASVQDANMPFSWIVNIRKQV